MSEAEIEWKSVEREAVDPLQGALADRYDQSSRPRASGGKQKVSGTCSSRTKGSWPVSGAVRYRSVRFPAGVVKDRLC